MKPETKEKWNKFAQALKSPSPETIYTINMQQYIMQAIGTIIVCAVLLYQKQMWWLIFAFVFSLLGCYTGYVTNRIQREQVLAVRKLMNPQNEFEEIEKEISPSRKKSKIIKKIMGIWGNLAWLITLSLVGLAAFSLWNWAYQTFWTKFLFALILFIATIIIHLFVYYFAFFRIANHFYNKQLKKYKSKEKLGAGLIIPQLAIDMEKKYEPNSTNDL
jgi:uncharacterized membrane protein